jgi:hypothetical protein
VPDTPHTDPGDPLLLSYLAQNDAPCPVCDYNLRGLKTDHCPECAAKLHLRVGSENLTLGPWLAAVLSFGLAVGFDAVVTLIFSVMFTVSRFASPPPPPYVTNQFIKVLSVFLTLTLTCGIAILILVRRRRRWMMLPRRAQWRYAAIIFASVFIAHLITGFLLARSM